MARLGTQDNNGDVSIGVASIPEIEAYWETIADIIDKSGYEGMDPTMNIADLENMLLKDYFNLIVIVVESQLVGIAVVYTTQMPQCKVGHVLLVSGSGMFKWGKQLSRFIRQWFTMQNCAYVQRISNSPSWNRWDDQAEQIGIFYQTKL